MEAPDDSRHEMVACLAGGGEMGALMRSTDWSKTPLGPPESWPQSLHSALSICLNSRFPIAIYWGRDLALLYNDTWRPIPGDKHPWALGRPGRDVWPEIWETIGPLFHRVQATAEGVWQEDQLLPMHRHGYTEECYFNFTFSPIRAEDGSIGGIFNAVVETTFRVIEERRARVLRELGERTVRARSADDACALAAEALGSAAADVPFCLLYLIDADRKRARLAGAAGLTPGGPASPASLEVAAAAPWPLREALDSGQAALVDGLGDRLGFALPGGPWPEPVESALVTPVGGLREGEPAGFLIAGISPRRALDDAYRAFLERAAGHVASAIANARAYEEERKRAEALAEIDRAKTAFFSNVSHEFRTPLTLMLGPLEDALASAALPREERERLDVARRNSLRLLKLVNSLLDFSRIEAGRVQASYQPIDLASLTAELASNFRSACEKAGLALDVDCPPLGEPVYVDRDMWEKIVLNLVSNAFKYTLHGGIAISLRRDGDHVALSVRDTGIGVPAHEIPRLFDRFHRVEGAGGRTHEGTGIGLALVQELVKLHGGTARVESALGEGSTFTVTIPLGTAHLPPGRISAAPALVSTALGAQPYVEEALRWLPNGQGATASESGIERALLPEQPLQAAAASEQGARATILLADDNADMRDYVRRLLGTLYEVRTVADGEAALAALSERRPDLLLSDVMMPRLDGFALLRAVRADPALADLPVVLLSARAGEEASIEGLGAGADDYLVKPFSARELIARVNANLALSRARRDVMAALEESERRTRELFKQAPGFVCVLSGPDHVFEFANDSYLRFVSGRDVIGKPVREIFPELDGQGFFELLDDVYRTGEPFTGSETLVQLRRAPGGPLERLFLNFIYQPITDAAGKVSGIFVEGFDVTDRVAAQGALRESEARYRTLFNSIDEGFCIIEAVPVAEGEPHDYRYVAANPALEEKSGVKDVVGKTIRGVIPGEAQSWIDTFDEILRTGEPVRFERELLSQGRVLDLYAFPLEGEARGRVGVIFQDISARKRAEMALRELNESLERKVEERTRALDAEMAERRTMEAAFQQVQRLEAIGQLTGGVAHDFNNLLTVVVGQADAIIQAAEGNERVTRMAASARRAAERGAQLTGQLLAFARRQNLQPEPVNVRRLIASFGDLVRRAVGEAVTVEIGGDPEPWPSLVDPAQLESAILNLAINARDAMPDGGRLTVETRNVALGGAEAWRLDVAPGDYVVVSVTDGGAGMPPEVQQRCFEPFFTTKEVGKGTGLGLSQAYGFARQSGGTATVDSAVGRGTTVALYLPRGELDEAEEQASAETEQRRGQGQVILLVEDQADVREVVELSLRDLGYRILTAQDGVEARRLLESDQPIDLLLTDVVMPNGVNGIELARAARRLRQDLKVVLVSGYARDAKVRAEGLSKDWLFLDKPFRQAELAAAVAAALGGKVRPARAATE